MIVVPAQRNVANESHGANPDDRLIDEREAARRLGLKVATLRRWRWARRGPRWVKIGAAVRYEPPEITALIEAGRQHPNPNAA
jgi:predicted DNA-binding transcriptional regulator AlpA